MQDQNSGNEAHESGPVESIVLEPFGLDTVLALGRGSRVLINHAENLRISCVTWRFL